MKIKRWVIWISFSLFATGLFAQKPTGIWWKDCELDTRYDRAYDREHTFGEKNPYMGGWRIEELTRFAEEGDACMQNLLGRYYNGAEQGALITNIKPFESDNLSWLTHQRIAAKWFRLAAEQGHGDAQVSIAGHYLQGYGVRQDYVEAAKWYKKAADQALSCPQLQLGEMYRDGQGVRRDYVQGHMWMNLAATNETTNYCSRTALNERQAIAYKMTPAQIEEAQRLGREWKSRISEDPIGRRTYKK
jgi:TPR repeat protein